MKGQFVLIQRENNVFTRCPSPSKVSLGCDIWQVDVVADEFENPIKLNLKSSDSISVGHPCISEDGSMLIFASDMVMNSKGVKSYGGKDLWYVLYDKKLKNGNRCQIIWGLNLIHLLMNFSHP